MKSIINGEFYNPTCGNLSADDAIKEMISYMQEKPDKYYEVIVGCDSSSGTDPHFPIAVAILRTGEGGRFFLRKVVYSSSMNKKFIFWKNRILEEVLLSCELALSLKEDLKKKMESLGSNLNYQFRYIHADIGENGKTKDMIKELTGLIRGNGFETKIKPESYVASIVADRYS